MVMPNAPAPTNIASKHGIIDNQALPGDHSYNGSDDVDDSGMPHAHYLGVKPCGNVFVAHKNLTDNMGTFQKLPDETILTVMEWLDSQSLLNIGASCRGLFAYSSTDQLWRELFIL